MLELVLPNLEKVKIMMIRKDKLSMIEISLKMKTSQYSKELTLTLEAIILTMKILI
jgi:hypothetical protein